MYFTIIIITCGFCSSAGLHVNVVRWLQPWLLSGKVFNDKHSLREVQLVHQKLHVDYKDVGGVETLWGLNQEVSMVSQVPARVLWFTCGAFCHPGPGCFATCSMLIQDSSFLATSSEIFYCESMSLWSLGETAHWKTIMNYTYHMDGQMTIAPWIIWNSTKSMMVDDSRW